MTEGGTDGKGEILENSAFWGRLWLGVGSTVRTLDLPPLPPDWDCNHFSQDWHSSAALWLPVQQSHGENGRWQREGPKSLIFHKTNQIMKLRGRQKNGS